MSLEQLCEKFQSKQNYFYFNSDIKTRKEKRFEILITLKVALGNTPDTGIEKERDVAPW